jgi:hypothetical protein
MVLVTPGDTFPVCGVTRARVTVLMQNRVTTRHQCCRVVFQYLYWS